MLIDFPAVRRALLFVPSNPTAVLVGAVLYAVVFAFQSYFTALAGAGDLGAVFVALGLVVLASLAFVVAMAAWGRIALDKPAAGFMGLAFGRDESRLSWAVLLIFILSMTVLGTAFLAVAFMVAALALINVDPEAPPPAEGDVTALGLLGTGEWIVAGIIFAVYAVFSLWFFLRLAMAYPATLDAGRIQIMRVWPLSGKGRSIRIFTTVLGAAVPGVLALWALNAGLLALTGIYPAAAQSASGEAGELVVPAFSFLTVCFVYGVAKAALVGAPVCAALCALYQNLSEKPPTADF